MLPSLERKVPPPVVAIIAAGVMWLLASEVVVSSYEVPNKVAICSVLAALGFLVDFAALWLFMKAKTTVNPIKPNKASSLVTGGIYRYTRNPMYIGNFIFLLAWLAWLGSAYGFIGLILYVVYMNQFQIKPEERALLSLFGNEYSLFCSNVRRWV